MSLFTKHSTPMGHAKFSTNSLFLATDLLSGMFYCDITDRLPFISMKGNTHMNINNHIKIRLFGEKHWNRFTEMMTLTYWGSLHLPETEWYTNFISAVKRIYEMSFPLLKFLCHE